MCSNQPLTLVDYHQQLLSWKAKFPHFFSNQPSSVEQSAFAKMLRLVILTALQRTDPNKKLEVENFLLFANNIQWLIRIDILTQSGQENQLVALKKWIDLIQPEMELNHFALPEMIIHALQDINIASLITSLSETHQKSVSLSYLEELQTRAIEKINHAEAVIPHLNTVTGIFAARGGRALATLQGNMLEAKTFLQQFEDIVARMKMAVKLKESQIQLIKSLQKQMLPSILKLEDDGLEIKEFPFALLKPLLTQTIETIPEFKAFRDYVKYNEKVLEENIRLAKESLERINRKYQDALKALPTNVDVKIYFSENLTLYSSLLKRPADHLETQIKTAHKLINFTPSSDFEQFVVTMREYANKYQTYNIQTQTVGAARKRFANQVEPIASELSKQLEANHLRQIILTNDLYSLDQIKLLMRKLLSLLNTTAAPLTTSKRLTALQLKQLAGKVGVSSDTTLVTLVQQIKPFLISSLKSFQQWAPKL